MYYASFRAGDRMPVGDAIFRTRPDRPWGPSSLLYNGYRDFPGGKAAGTWCWPPNPFWRRGYEYKCSHRDVKNEKDKYIVKSSRLRWGGVSVCDYSWRWGSDGVVKPYHCVFNRVPVCDKRIPVGNLDKGHALRFLFFITLFTKSRLVFWHTQLETARSMTFIVCICLSC
jgi:hypothetical protein